MDELGESLPAVITKSPNKSILMSSETKICSSSAALGLRVRHTVLPQVVCGRSVRPEREKPCPGVVGLSVVYLPQSYSTAVGAHAYQTSF